MRRNEEGALVVSLKTLVSLATIGATVIGSLAFASGWVASVRADAAFHERVEESLLDEKDLSRQVTQNVRDIATLQRAVTDLVNSQTDTNALMRQLLQRMSR